MKMLLRSLAVGFALATFSACATTPAGKAGCGSCCAADKCCPKCEAAQCCPAC